jgi:hypothetical protein
MTTKLDNMLMDLTEAYRSRREWNGLSFKADGPTPVVVARAARCIGGHVASGIDRVASQDVNSLSRHRVMRTILRAGHSGAARDGETLLAGSMTPVRYGSEAARGHAIYPYLRRSGSDFGDFVTRSRTQGGITD